MPGLVVVGLQWGDEGKGKLVDWLAGRADMVVRFQGGHNAGHTLVVDDVTYKLSLLPSGVLRGVDSVIGPGVVVDPWRLLEEIETLRPAPDSLLLADNACLILPWHRELDAAREENSSAGGEIGTTRRGIGPAYEDRVGRRALRVADLASPETLDDRLQRLLAHHRPLRAGLGLPPPDPEQLKRDLLPLAAPLLRIAGPVWARVSQAVDQGSNILFEGAQGAMLDIDHGTWPFVTSSSTVAAQAAVGCGVGAHAINAVLGVVKAYATRVGNGPFPTELSPGESKSLGQRGGEFGTVTGRARRCGWFDAVQARQACVQSGATAIALTKLDVLDGVGSIRVCTQYRLDGAAIPHLPAGVAAQGRVEPDYEELPGWPRSIRGARRFGDLPPEAQACVGRLEELLERPISLVSTSPERDDVIERGKLF